MSAPKDMKESLSSSRKPDITHVRGPTMTYIARQSEYGEDRYQRANFLRPAADTTADMDVQMRAAFKRLRAYLRAMVSHGVQVLDALEKHQALDPDLVDVEGMKIAAYAVDTDAPPDGKVGASLLPHIAGSAASVNMAIAQAVDCGLLPKDPGTPWRQAQAVVVQDSGVAIAEPNEIDKVLAKPLKNEYTGKYGPLMAPSKDVKR